jgi:hypothetical protein
MLGKSVYDGLRGVCASLVASYAIGDNEEVSKRGCSAGNAVLIFGAFLADIALHADGNY